MAFLFFQKSHSALKQKIIDAIETDSTEAEDSSIHSDRDTTGVLQPTSLLNSLYNRKTVRLVRSKELLDELLEKLLKNIEMTQGMARDHYLEQLVRFLTKNPSMLNRAPKGFDHNPLELVIRLGDNKTLKALLMMNAQVRPENRALLKQIEPLLRSFKLIPERPEHSFSLHRF